MKVFNSTLFSKHWPRSSAHRTLLIKSNYDSSASSSDEVSSWNDDDLELLGEDQRLPEEAIVRKHATQPFVNKAAKRNISFAEVQICTLRVQKWWRMCSISRRYRCIKRNTQLWKQILHQNEAVVHGSICLKQGHSSSFGLGSEVQKRGFLLLTTLRRLIWCDPVSRKVYKMYQLEHGRATCCDLGDNTFSVNFISERQADQTFVFKDLMSASFNWLTTLRDLPDMAELSKITRRNSLRPFNFPILLTGQVTRETDFKLRIAVGLRQKRVIALHGCRLVVFNDNAGERDLVDLDQFTSVQSEGATSFTIQTLNGGQIMKWTCGSERERDCWVREMQTIIDNDIRCTLRRRGI